MSLMGDGRFGIEAGIEACDVWMEGLGIGLEFSDCWLEVKDGCIDGLLTVAVMSMI